MIRQKVLVFRPDLADGGADRVTITLLRELDRARFDPVLVLMHKSGVLLHEVPADVPVHGLGAGRLRTSALAMARAIARERPDVVLSTSSGGNMIASLGRLLSGWACRLVLSERTTFTIARRERFPRVVPIVLAKRFLYRQADRIIAVSQGVADDLVRAIGLPRDLITVIYNPVVDAAMTDRAEATLDHPWFADGTPVILAAGRLINQKDYPTLLRAFLQLRRRRPVRLIVLGEGPLRGALEQLAADLGIAADVQFPGFVANPLPYMRRCTVFALSSRFEGLPGVLIQAMACGTAVVSTDCPSGPSEIIEPGTSGFLVPVGDPAALAGAIGRLLDDPDLRHAVAAAAARRAQRFGVPETIHEYERVLEGARPSSGDSRGAA
ncbi:MAG TPA: glycosyltransferase [bacterium]|jgi:glycosyltransferase involved in cell wall biosynthesis|nr:glycosyltransferase [bacterium]